MSAKKGSLSFPCCWCVLLPFPPLFNVERWRCNYARAERESFFAGGMPPFLHSTIFEERGEGSQTLWQCDVNGNLFFADTGTLKTGVGCAECVHRVSSRTHSGHVHSLLRAANVGPYVWQCYKTYEILHTATCDHAHTLASVRLLFLKIHSNIRKSKDHVRIILRIIIKTNENLRIVRIVV